MTFFDHAIAILDWIFAALIMPTLQHGQALLLSALDKPFAYFGLSVTGQVIAVSVITAVISLALKKLLGIETKEKAYKENFTRKKSLHGPIAEIGDWRKRDLLYHAIDRELDDEYNTYLAGRFARHGIVYLLPVFSAFILLQNLLAAEPAPTGEAPALLIARFTENNPGMEGISVSLVFFIAYLSTLALWHALKKMSGCSLLPARMVAETENS